MQAHSNYQFYLQVFGAIAGDDWLAVARRENGAGGVDVSITTK